MCVHYEAVSKYLWFAFQGDDVKNCFVSLLSLCPLSFRIMMLRVFNIPLLFMLKRIWFGEGGIINRAFSVEIRARKICLRFPLIPQPKCISAVSQAGLSILV